jgi:hypothetical protein
METRAKDLKDFTMWNSANSGVKFFDFCDTIFTKNLFFRSDFAISSSQIHGKGFSEFNDKFAMTLFNDKKGQDLPAKVEQSMSCDYPFITISFKEFVSGFFKRCGACSLKRFLKPMEKSNVGIGNLENASIMAIFIAITRFVFKFASMKASFSINNAGKIGKMKRVMLFGDIKIPVFIICVFELLHKTSRFTNQYTHGSNLSPG